MNNERTTYTWVCKPPGVIEQPNHAKCYGSTNAGRSCECFCHDADKAQQLSGKRSA